MSESTQEKNKEEETILEFREESVSNVIYEDLTRFKNSVSSQFYQKAFDITRIIVSANSNYQSKEKKKQSGTVLRNQEQFFNIIVFSGERGTGKTSVMLSYMEFLKDYYRNFHFGRLDGSGELPSELCFKNPDNNYPMEVMFTGLEYIDASMLGEQKDDVLRNILPKMLKKWRDEEQRSYSNSGIVRDEDYAYKKRQVQMLFNNVYKSLRDLNSTKDILESDNDMFMETLENLSLTWNLRQSFQELVKAYLDIMEYPGSEEKIGSHNHFLVITLDDLDMNIEHGFELLEEIRKYLMVSNVIVLLSADYQQLKKLCIEHYTKVFRETKGEAGTKEYIIRLSKEYLDKILPAYCQVVMEPVNEWKFYDQENIRIKYTRINKNELDIKPATIKKIIQKQLADYFNIRLFTEGKCLRYFMPLTIRELAQWVRQLYSLDVLIRNAENGNEGINADTYRKNMHWFLRKKLYAMYDEYSTQSLTELDLLEPKDQVILMKQKYNKKDYLKYNQKDNSKDNGKDNEKDYQKDVSLLECLGGALVQTRSEQIDAVLKIFYLETKLSELFFKWHNGRYETEKAEALYNIRQYFGDRIWGVWEKKMMCRGFCTGVESEVYDIAIINFSKLKCCLNFSLRGNYTAKSKKDFVLRNKQRLINYQLLLMFFDFEGEFDFSLEKFSGKSGDYQIILKEDKQQGVFALSNIMRSWETKEKVISAFLENFLKVLDTKENEELEKNILDLIDIRKREYNYINIPLENIEYLIYTGQRLEREFGGKFMEMKLEEIMQRITKYFSLIRDSLVEYDLMHNTKYKEEFDNTQIGIDLNLKRSDYSSSNGNLLNMLAESICHVAAPELADITD